MSDYTCVNCNEPIRFEVSWPGGRKIWMDRTLYVGSFCAAADGRPHEPSSFALEVEGYLRTLNA